MKTVIKRIVPIAFGMTMLAMFALGYWWGNTGSPKSATPGAVPDAGKATGRILYYRNPMGLPDTSPVPRKDPMGMDYIPVYEGGEPAARDAAIRISPDRIQKLGVKTEAVALRELARTVKAVATVQADERRLYTVAPRFEGWIQRLHVNTTGQAVKKGDPLMDVYSPELITAQHEYLIARRGSQQVESAGSEVQEAMERLAESALQRLRNWDISETDLRALRQKGQFTHSVMFRSAVNGIVLDKPAIQGKRFMAGEVLYQIADLSVVWMLADVFEQDLALVSEGQAAAIRIEAYPETEFNGEVTFVYPTVNPQTRTAKVRIELPNPRGLLKPAMYGRVEIALLPGRKKVVAMPRSAVLDTGTRRVALVDLGEGRFEPREVKLGVSGDDHVEVLDGLKAGEMVVVSANFLIDAESNLKAALAHFAHGKHDRQAPISGEPGEEREAPPGASARVSPDAPVSHRGEGTVEAIDPVRGSVTLAHDPIESLGWPAMTMDFKVKEPALLQTLKPGQQTAFQVTKSPAGEYVIVRIVPRDSSARHGRH